MENSSAIRAIDMANFTELQQNLLRKSLQEITRHAFIILNVYNGDQDMVTSAHLHTSTLIQTAVVLALTGSSASHHLAELYPTKAVWEEHVEKASSGPSNGPSSTAKSSRTGNEPGAQMVLLGNEVDEDDSDDGNNDDDCMDDLAARMK